MNNLVEDIYKALEPLCKEEPVEISDSVIEKFGEDMKKVLRSWSTPEKRPNTFKLRMSNVGKPLRQLWYDNKYPEKSNFEPKTFIKFLYGHILEEVVLMLVRLSGHEVTDEQKEITIEGIKGHMDCKIDGKVVDVKSASGYAFRKFKYGGLAEDDPFGYLAQLSGYEQAEKQEDSGFLVINKESGELCLYCPEDLEKPNTAMRIKNISSILKEHMPPERCYPTIPEGSKGNLKINKNCSYCPHKFRCYHDANDGQGLRTFRYSKGFVYLTKVVKEPNVEEVL